MLTLVLLYSCVLFAPFSVSSAENKSMKDENVSASETVEITGSKYVAVGKTIRLKASQKVKWSSSNDAIASVSKSGRVKGLKPGKARITATTSNGAKKSWTIIVKAHPVQKMTIKAKTKRLDLNGNQSTKLKATAFPKDAAQSFTWKSSNPAVATVSATGKVTATGVGKVKITATATDGSKKSKSVTLRVTDSGTPTPEPSVTPEPTATPEPSESPASSSTPAPETHRALLIGEESFLEGRYDYGLHQFVYYIDSAKRNTGDINHMASMLKKVSGTDGGKYHVTAKKDASFNMIQSLIQSTFADTTDQDVSLFFIATHGDSDGDGELVMPFLGDPRSEDDRNEYYNSVSSPILLPFDTLASWLDTYVKGEVIVIIESCGSGSAIYSPDEVQNHPTNAGGAAWNFLNGQEYERIVSASETGFNEAAFISEAIKAFSSRDHSIKVSNQGQGALRQSKFYVLASARHQEECYGKEDDSSNYFTDWLVEGVGNGSRSPADADHDGLITLTELFDYIKTENDIYNRTWPKYQQHVQRYPVGSQYALFKVN